MRKPHPANSFVSPTPFAANTWLTAPSSPRAPSAETSPFHDGDAVVAVAGRHSGSTALEVAAGIEPAFRALQALA